MLGGIRRAPGPGPFGGAGKTPAPRRGPWAHREGGQAAVELALVLPALILVLVGLVQVGVALSAYLTLQTAAYEGARLATTGATTSAIVSRIDAVAADIPPSALNISVSPAPPLTYQSNVTVSVTYDLPVAFGAVAHLWGASIPLTASVTMEMD